MPNVKITKWLSVGCKKNKKNVDERTTDTYLSYKLTFEPSAQSQINGQIKHNCGKLDRLNRDIEENFCLS